MRLYVNKMRKKESFLKSVVVTHAD